jgi:hypothetical protein
MSLLSNKQYWLEVFAVNGVQQSSPISEVVTFVYLEVLYIKSAFHIMNILHI